MNVITRTKFIYLEKDRYLLNTYSTLIEQHAAAIVSSKMVVFGGDSGQRLLDDTKVSGSSFSLSVLFACMNSALCDTILLSNNLMTSLIILIRY